MHYLATIVLVAMTAGGTWYGTREITRSQDRAAVLAERLAESQARVQRLTEQVTAMESRLANHPASQPAAAETPAIETKSPETRQAAARAMRSVDAWLSVVAKNLDNAHTAGYKRGRVTLGANPVDVHDLSTCLEVGEVQRDFTQGAIDPTNRSLDWAIDGEGFFQVRTNRGGKEVTAYTRAGSFVRNADGTLVLTDGVGSVLDPKIILAPDMVTSEVVVTSDGRVQVAGRGGKATEVGRIELARFSNVEGLVPISEYLFVRSEASGPPITGLPGTDGLGSIQAGCLEASNVEIVREKVDMLFAQRAFDVNSQFWQGLAYRTALTAKR
jgi:flagellar basal-body rod protein FlgG